MNRMMNEICDLSMNSRAMNDSFNEIFDLDNISESKISFIDTCMTNDCKN